MSSIKGRDEVTAHNYGYSLIGFSVEFKSPSKRIPSIIEFVESPQYLGNSRITLWPAVRVILKAFYLGTVGNDGPEASLTPEELKVAEESGLNDWDKGNLVSKLAHRHPFNELVMMSGRRTGKNLISEIITLYEAMKLLEVPGGDAYASFDLPYGAAPLSLITVFMNMQQAAIACGSLKAHVQNSPYFSDKFMPRGLRTHSIDLLTPMDKSVNEELLRQNLPIATGTVQIRFTAARSQVLIGIQAYMLTLMNPEVFPDARHIYKSTFPSLATFRSPKGQAIGGGKCLVFAGRGNRRELADDLFAESPMVPGRLAVRPPSWAVIPGMTEAMLRNEFSMLSNRQFQSEFASPLWPLGDPEPCTCPTCGVTH